MIWALNNVRVVVAAVAAVLILLWLTGKGVDPIVAIVKVAIPVAVLIGDLYVVMHTLLNVL